jgi:Transposase DDE domain.
VNLQRGLWSYGKKVFALPQRLAGVSNHRCQPEIPTRSITASLFLAAVMRVGSFLQLQSETARPGWQRLTGWPRPISDDALVYALERYDLEDLRQVVVDIHKTLKRNKALESAKINGLLVVALDANEQFHSRHRCCEACCQRTVQIKDKDGQVRELTEFYHRQVYAQMHGPDFSTILDLEPIRPGEDEAAAALRLLGRMRRTYGPRFFDVVTVDAWYATEPFFKGVLKLGWPVVAVLKQERYDIYKEASALSREQAPKQMELNNRQVKLRDVRDLTFGKTNSMRVVLAEESWEQNKRVGKETIRETVQTHWRWLLGEQLNGYGPEVIWRIGHQRWGIENHAFNELTQHYHLTHCPHHEPVAIVAWLLFLVLGFTIFELFVHLNSKLWRQGRTTMKELWRQLDHAMERVLELEPLWSG